MKISNETNRKSPPFIFFGTPNLAVFVLDELEKGGFLPAAVVTAPDRPAGRGMRLTAPPVKVWAQERDIPVLQPETLDAEFIYSLPTTNYSLFIVAAYGKIIPQEVLNIPQHGTLNVHPSLLPTYRGPSPIEAAIVNGDKETGVTIMEIDTEMDHGPILAQQVLEITNHKQQNTNKTQISNTQIPNKGELGETLFRIGGEILVDIIPKWVAGEIESTPQNHEQATYTKKLAKQDGCIDIEDDPQSNWRKFRAYSPWPGVFFFKDNKRIKITDAALENGTFVIKRVVPENGKEMSYEQFKQQG